ncbi:MAG: hypothetical protein GVY31_00660 [Alphaproteobacteria bacterium]|nr:hypothetical protein [Alphaproteobacteria bacterium]
MTQFARSTIAALCFANPTRIDFQTLKRDLGEAFANSHGADYRITSDYDDFIVYDLLGGRVCLGYVDFENDLDAPPLPGLPSEALIVSVGGGPGMQAETPLYRNREELCRGLAHEIDRVAPADHLLVFDRDEMVDADVYDRLVDLVRQLVQSQPGAIPTPVEPTRPRRPAHASARPTSRPTHPPMAADRISILRQQQETERLRAAVFAEADEEEIERQIAGRLTRRLAIYTMNGGVILLSAPIGMAALTCCVLGRESERVPARALALTGAVMGVMQSGFGLPVLSHLV